MATQNMFHTEALDEAEQYWKVEVDQRQQQIVEAISKLLVNFLPMRELSLK